MTYKKFFSYSVFPLPGNGREGGMRNFFSFLRRREKKHMGGGRKKQKREYMKFSFRERGSCFPEIRIGKVWLPIESAKKIVKTRQGALCFHFLQVSRVLLFKGFPRKRK